MKYIIVESFELPLAILFDEILNHSDIAKGQKVVSAGKCGMDGVAYGSSVSLKLNARPEDSRIIRDSMYRTC